MPQSLLVLVFRIILVVWFITVFYSVLIMIFGKNLFKKANLKPSAAFIPIINLFSTLEITDISTLLGVFMFIPGLNIGVLALMSYKLGKVFNCGFGFKMGLVLLPIVFYPVLAFSDKSYKLSDDEYFRGIENSRLQQAKTSITDEDEQKPFVNDQIEERGEKVDSIFKSDVEMMEKVAPYRAGKIDLLGLEKLEKAGENKDDSSKVLKTSDIKSNDDDDMEMIDL